MKKWNERPQADKFMLVVRIVASLLVVVFAALQLLGVWDKAINLAAPLMGIVLLIQSAQEWKQHRSVAIFGLCAALFIFGCAIVVWFFGKVRDKENDYEKSCHNCFVNRDLSRSIVLDHN